MEVLNYGVAPREPVKLEYVLWRVFAVIVIVAGSLAINSYSELLFHSFAEVFIVTVALGVFTVVWNGRQFLPNDYLKVVGIGYAFCGFVDLLHTLTRGGMNVLPAYGPGLTDQFWLLARYLQAATLLAAPFFIKRRIGGHALIGIYLAAVAASLALVFSGRFPDCFIPDVGPTKFNIVSEHGILVIFLVSAWLFYQRRQAFGRKVYSLILLSLLTNAASEAFFTGWAPLSGTANVAGHLLKLAEFYFMYQAVVVTCLNTPFDLIFRDLKLTEEALLKTQNSLEDQVRERTSELALANEKLKESEVKYRQIVDTAREGIMGFGPDGLIMFANARMGEMLGYSVDAMMGRPAAGFLFEEDAADHARMVERRRRNISDCYERRFRHKDGHAVWTLVSGVPVFSGEGEYQGAFAMFTDNTTRREAEQALIAQARQFRTVLENIPDFIVRYTPDLRRTYVNRAWEEAGMATGEVTATDQAKAPPAARGINEEYIKRVREVFASGAPRSLEFAWENARGETLYLDCRIVPETGLDGKVATVLCVGHDITARRAAEMEQQRLSRELGSLPESVRLRLCEALSSLDGGLIAAAIAEAGETDAELAGRLSRLAENFGYPAILRALEARLH